MSALTVKYDPDVIAGFDGAEDAGVYKISDRVALVQTLDFMTPIVDDPFTFGRIAAANSLSDVYAMGGRPVTAMNIVCFPVNKFSLDILADILKGGLSVLEEAGVQLLGGHSVDDSELKYGLSITGLIDPARVIRNRGIKSGNKIILVKPLGTGIIGTAVKAGIADKKSEDEFIESMTMLNKDACDIMLRYPITAATDVTGFGLAGHLKEMISDDCLRVSIESKSLPLIYGIKDLAEMGIIPAGLYRNRDYSGSICSFSADVPQYMIDLIFDPQTSGGMLIAVDESSAEKLTADMHSAGYKYASIIATVSESENPEIYLE